MDAFDLACERVPEHLQTLLEKAPRPLRHADFFVHSLRQRVVELGSSLRGSRFGPPDKKHRQTAIEGLAVRTISDVDDRFAATDDLSASGVLRLIDRHTDDGENAPRIVETADDASRDNLGVAAQAVHDVTLGVHPGVTAAKTLITEIAAHRAVAAIDSSPAVLRDHHNRIEVKVKLAVGDRDLTVVRTVLAAELGSLDFDDLAMSVGHELAARLAQSAHRIPVPADSLPVVLPSGWGGVWMHEAIGHQAESDAILSGLSSLSKKLNQMVGPKGLTIRDVAVLAGGRVDQAFDDEGTPSRNTVVVERGRFVGILSDRLSSIREDIPMTGNGRRAHYAQKPRPRMTNLVLDAGADTQEDLVSDLHLGIEVEEIRHAWFSPADKLVYLEVLESRLIERGRPAGHLEPLTLSATPCEILKRIEGIGNDFSMDSLRGYCVKDGAAIPVGVGQPTVLISSMRTAPART